MRKGPKIIIGIIIAILVIVGGIFAVYYISFKPAENTTSVGTASEAQANSVAQKFSPQNIEKEAVSVGDGNKEVSLTGQELSNVVAYAVSKEPSVSKYVTGVKVQPENDNKIAVYATGQLKGVESQAKLDFKVISENGKTMLKYDGGKVGFISIPESELFNRLHDNSYITVDKQNGTITVNPNAISGQTIDGINVDSSNLNVILKDLGNN